MTGTLRLLVGTYPPAGAEAPPGQGEGLWALDLDVRTGGLAGRKVATTPAPSFLAVRGGAVLAVGETSPGRVTRLTPDADGALVERETVSSGGSGPCHVLWPSDPAAGHPAGHPGGHPGGAPAGAPAGVRAGSVAYVANYGSGSVAVVPVTDDGAFTGGVAQVFEHSGRGPDDDRQEGPHVHSTVLAPGGAHLLAADLGTDEIRRYRVQPDGLLAEDGLAAVLPPGTGPRHMALGPGGHVYVVGELDGTVHVLRWTGEHLEPGQVLPACAAPVRTGDRSLPGHIVVTGGEPSGGSVSVLVSVRGADVLARFEVHDDGARLEHVADVALGGAWPRHFAVVGDLAVVALQESGRVVSVRWQGGPGGAVVDGLDVPSPACVVAVPE